MVKSVRCGAEGPTTAVNPDDVGLVDDSGVGFISRWSVASRVINLSRLLGVGVTQSLTAIPIALTPFQGQRPSIRFSTGINVSMILS